MTRWISRWLAPASSRVQTVVCRCGFKTFTPCFPSTLRGWKVTSCSALTSRPRRPVQRLIEARSGWGNLRWPWVGEFGWPSGVTRSGGRSYVKLVEAFRDDAGLSRQRVIATLGRLEQVRSGSADALVNGLRRVTGDAPACAAPTDAEAVRFSTALSVGDTWLLTALWHRLGFADAFRRVLRNGRTSFDCERLLRVMVFNRLCDSTSKLGVLRWLEQSRVPAVDTASVTHQRLLRAMDTLAERADALQRSLSVLLRPLIDQELSVVFYDLTTVGVEGATELPGDVRDYGMSKDGGIARQFMLGVVQTAEGLPIAHRVWQGNTGEALTLEPVIKDVLAHYPVKRVVLVADRGLLSLDNLAQLQRIRTGGKEGRPLEFILAVPGRRYAEFAELLQPLHDAHCAQAGAEVMGEAVWKVPGIDGEQSLRLVWAHRPARPPSKASAASRPSTNSSPRRRRARASSTSRIRASPSRAGA